MTSINVDKLTVMSWSRTHVGCNLSEDISVKWSSPKLLPDPPVIHHSTETLSKSFIQHFPGKIFMQMTKSWGGPSSSTSGIFHLSVLLSLCSHHCIIMKFSGVITNDQSKVKVRGQRSRSQRWKPNLIVSGLYLQLEFRYDDEMMHTAWCCKMRCLIVFQCHPTNFKVTWLTKLLNLTQIGHFRTVTPVWIHQWLRNDAQSLEVA